MTQWIPVLLDNLLNVTAKFATVIAVSKQQGEGECISCVAQSLNYHSKHAYGANSIQLCAFVGFDKVRSNDVGEKSSNRLIRLINCNNDYYTLNVNISFIPRSNYQSRIDLNLG